jgi:hypothetical protein
VWHEVLEYLKTKEPAQLQTALRGPKQKMAMVFRWYLHMSSRWAVEGRADREVDYQIWCGPSMAAFNQWVKGSFLEGPEARQIVPVAKNLLYGAATLMRARFLAIQGVPLPPQALSVRPRQFPMAD